MTNPNKARSFTTSREELIKDINSGESARQLQKRFDEIAPFDERIKRDCEVDPDSLKKPMTF